MRGNAFQACRKHVPIKRAFSNTAQGGNSAVTHSNSSNCDLCSITKLNKQLPISRTHSSATFLCRGSNSKLTMAGRNDIPRNTSASYPSASTFTYLGMPYWFARASRVHRHLYGLVPIRLNVLSPALRQRADVHAVRRNTQVGCTFGSYPPRTAQCRRSLLSIVAPALSHFAGPARWPPPSRPPRTSPPRSSPGSPRHQKQDRPVARMKNRIAAVFSCAAPRCDRTPTGTRSATPYIPAARPACRELFRPHPIFADPPAHLGIRPFPYVPSRLRSSL